MDLAILWSSLPTMLKISRGKFMTSGVEVVMNGWGSPHVFSEPFCKSSAWFPNIFFFTIHPATLTSVDHPIFLEDGVFVLGVYQEVLDGTASFEMHFNDMFPADILAALTHSLNTWHHLICLVVVVEACIVPAVTGNLVLLDFFCLMLALFKAHTGYLHLLSACLRWSSSSLGSWLLEQTVFALCLKVLITLNLADRWWWLSHCKCKFVCVGLFVHRCKERIIRLWHHYCIQEGDGPICFTIFCCKFDVWVHLDVLQKYFFLCRIYDHKSVIYISHPYSWRMFRYVDGLYLKVLHTEVGHNGADWRPHGCSFNCSKNLPWNWK